MKVLITAGPTREKIDPIRFISNRSSGRMGYALAAAARDAGHEVTLISGPVALTSPEGVQVVAIESAADLSAAVRRYAETAQLVIMAAAVADYRPAHPIDTKLKKNSGPLFLELERTEDILSFLGSRKPEEQTLVGFAAESGDLESSARSKLLRKNLDWVVGNLLADGFATEDDRLLVLGRNGERREFPRAKKTQLAVELIRLFTAGKEN